MSEDNNPDYYFQLIPRYLSGNASDAEVRQLEDWVLASEENKAQFKAFKKAWILSGMAQRTQTVDVEKEWTMVSGALFPEGKTLPLPGRRRTLWRIAAAMAILLAASLWLFQFLDRDKGLELITRDAVADNQLPDGTQIAMNQYSTLSYAPQDKKVRRVELSGDAFFEVERDTARPFVITTPHLEIEVLGTAFYVDAREEQPEVQVIVQSGTVAVSAGDERLILTAGDIGIYEKTTGSLTKKTNDDLNYMAWKTDVLTFENTPLERVVFDLNRKFHARISIADQAIRQCKITATYDHQSLDAIVKIIEKTLNIRAEEKNGAMIFTGQGCG